MKVKLLLTFALLLTAVTGAWADFTPRDGDVWDEATKTLTVNSDPDGSYYGNGEIQHLVIASGVTSIGDFAFNDCQNLTSVSIPASVTSVGSCAFDNTPWLEGQPDGVVYVGKVAYKWKGDAAIAAITDGTVSISPSAFEGCTSLATVIIPASVTSIGDFAFYDCQNLTSVIVYATTPPALGGSVFEGYAGDCEIYVPEGTVENYQAGWNNYVDYITVIPIKESGACENGMTLELIKLTANSNNYILTISGTGDMGDMDSNPLWENYKSDITTVVIGDGVTSIGDYAFYDCTSLTTVSIPASVTSIGDFAFNSCQDLTSVIIPASVTSIGNYAFQSCTKLEYVYVLPTTPPTIGHNPFNACNALTAIVVPAAAYDTYYYDDVKGWSTYQSKLKKNSGNCGTTGSESSVTWSYNLTTKTLTISGTGQMMYYGSALGGDSKYHSTAPWSYLDSEIQKVIVENGVTYIGSYAFAYCTALTSVSLPATVSQMGNYVCYSSNVTRIDIPATGVVSLGTDGFDYTPAGLVIAVPAELLATYKTATNWSEYEAKMVGVLSESTGFGTTFATGNYEYSRTFNCGVAATLCLPFELNSAQISPYGKVYTFDGVDKTTEPTWTVVMREDAPSNSVTGNLEANTPYLFLPYILEGKSKGDAMTITFNGGVTAAGNAGYAPWDETSVGTWTFQGVYYNVAWNDGNADLGSVYGFAAQSYNGSDYTVNPGDFVKAMAGASIAPFRAFLKFTPVSGAPRRGAAEEALPSRMSVRLVNADGDVTAIGTIDTKTGEIRFDSDAWYTLDGRRLNGKPSLKGMYINNGKKIIVK